MKISKYNSLINISKGVYLHYNSLQNCFLLSRLGADIFDKQEYTPKLQEGGFLVDDPAREEQLLRERFYRIIEQENEFILTINPTLDCNFSCWYCYEEKCSKAYMSKDILERILLLLDRLDEKFKSIHVSFFGGEPLLYFDKVVLPILEHLKSLSDKHSCSFTTNAALLSERMVQVLKKENVSNMQITLDGNRELHDKTRFFKNGKGSYDIILKNIVSLLKNEIPVTLRINYTSENLGSIHEIAEDLRKLLPKALLAKLRIRLHQVWQTADIDLSEEVEQIIEHLSVLNFQVDTPVFDNVFAPCYADYKHSAVINYNGDIYKCTAVDFLNRLRDGYLAENGELVWENDSLVKRMESRFKNPPCRSCRIQPICNGGCSQKAVDYSGQNYCVCSFSEDKKDQVVKERFSAYLRSRKTKL